MIMKTSTLFNLYNIDLLQLHLTSFNPQNLRNIIKKVAKISIIQILMSNLSVKTTVFCSFLDIPQILHVYASSR